MQNKKRIEDLDVGIWEISFIKKDGSTRTLLGTRDLSIIKEVGSEHLPKGTGKPNSSVPIFDLKEKNKVFFLGQKNYPAITSATWNPNVALDFIEEFPTDKYSILYQIDQKNGVTIDSISKFPREEEVIIGSRSSFELEI